MYKHHIFIALSILTRESETGPEVPYRLNFQGQEFLVKIYSMYIIMYM